MLIPVLIVVILIILFAVYPRNQVGFRGGAFKDAVARQKRERRQQEERSE
jgi:hypothetical protein